jgi:microcystin-dependent protein
VPFAPGQGPGLSNYALGQKGGQETHVLTVQELASHNHTVAPQAKNGAGDDTNPGPNRYMASASTDLYANTPTANLNMGASTSSNTGGNVGHNNMQPYLAVNYVSCLFGVFPSRS